MFRKLPDKKVYQTLRQKDANHDVRSHAAFAIKQELGHSLADAQRLRGRVDRDGLQLLAS
jgi:hypothetical protein